MRHAGISHHGQRARNRSRRGCSGVWHLVGTRAWTRGGQSMKRHRILIAVISVILLVLIAWMVTSWATRDRFRSTADRLLLLVPDGTSFSDPKVAMWLDAGSEEGLHVVPVHDSDFLRPLWGESDCAGVILPDSIHKQASDLLIATLRR